MSRFCEPMFCCHWFVLKNKFLHKPCHHNPLLCNYRHHPRKNREKRLNDVRCAMYDVRCAMDDVRWTMFLGVTTWNVAVNVYHHLYALHQ